MFIPRTFKGMCYGKYRGLAPMKRFGIKNVPFYFYSIERVVFYRVMSKAYSVLFGKSK